MHLEHEELARRLESRLDKIESKLDKYLESANSNSADLKWVKGYIRVSVGLFVSVFAGLLTALTKLFNHS